MSKTLFVQLILNHRSVPELYKCICYLKGHCIFKISKRFQTKIKRNKNQTVIHVCFCSAKAIYESLLYLSDIAYFVQSNFLSSPIVSCY